MKRRKQTIKFRPKYAGRVAKEWKCDLEGIPHRKCQPRNLFDVSAAVFAEEKFLQFTRLGHDRSGYLRLFVQSYLNGALTASMLDRSFSRSPAG